MPKRKKFSEAFKREAVELTRPAEVTVAQVARELGLNATLLSKWRRQRERESEKAASLCRGVVSYIVSSIWIITSLNQFRDY